MKNERKISSNMQKKSANTCMSILNFPMWLCWPHEKKKKVMEKH